MCCCCWRLCCPRKRCFQFIGVLVTIGVVLQLVLTVITMYVIEQDTKEILESYPELFRDEQDYHNTESIINNIWMNNALNPYYGEVNDLSLHTYGPRDGIDSVDVRVVIMCGQHAREIISSEICYNLMQLLQETKAHYLFSHRIAQLRLEKVGFWIVPVINGWGREQIEEDPAKACLRKNRNGVDLNRNFPCPDLEREDAEEETETHPGEFDLSEPESLGTLEVLEAVKPDILLNIHSGISRVLLPYDCCPMAMHKNYRKMLKVAQLAKRSVLEDLPDLQHISPREWHTGSSSQLLYQSHGTLGDYAAFHHQVPFVYTLETFQNTSVVEKKGVDLTPAQCMTMFNPSAGEVYKEVNMAWISFIISLIEHTLEHFTIVEQ